MENYVWSPLRGFIFGPLAPKPEPQPSLRDELITVFYPGFSSSRGQAAKYVAEEDGVQVLSPDDSKVLYVARTPNAPRLLHNVFPARDPPELGRGLTWNPLGWIQTITDTCRLRVLNIKGTPSSYMYLRLINLAGKNDQAECLRIITKAVEKAALENKKIILFGTSRGGATILATALQLPEKIAKWIALVVCEAGFDSLPNVIRKTSWFPRITMALLRGVGAVEKEGEHPDPLRVIQDLSPCTPIALQCPVVFVWSLKDKRVPASNVKNLCETLRSKQPQLDIRTLELAKSHHSMFSMHHSDDQALYLRFMGNLYDEICSKGSEPA